MMPLPAIHLPLPGGDLLYWPQVDLGMPANRLLDRLVEETEWRQDEITLFGQVHLTPRLSAWIGDPDCHYSYSNIALRPLPWTPLLLELRHQAEALCGHAFNSVLLNLYRDGADSMGCHADDEPELGPQPAIASLSLGQERPIVFRHKRDRSVQPVRLPLANGSLLLMRGNTQANWKHEIPKSRRPMGPRLNLTFRQILTRT